MKLDRLEEIYPEKVDKFQNTFKFILCLDQRKKFQLQFCFLSFPCIFLKMFCMLYKLETGKTIHTKLHFFVRLTANSSKALNSFCLRMKSTENIPWIPRRFQRAILSLHDMVRSLSPCITPSQVCTPTAILTGIVPSPDSIFVLSCPLAFLFGCLSLPSFSLPCWTSCGEKILESPHGAVLMYKWNFTSSFTLHPFSHSSKTESSTCAGSFEVSFSNWEYRNLIVDLRAKISAWKSFTLIPLVLRYSPLMHFVPVETHSTLDWDRSSPRVITMPARTFLRAYWLFRSSVSSANLPCTNFATWSASAEGVHHSPCCWQA